MNKMTPVKRITICAVCIALCYILPIATHALAVGSILSPMHIPVLLCGIVCGGGYGLICGIIGPVLSSVLSGMPPATALISMIPELAVYGLACGLGMRFIHTGKLTLDIYASLVPAMLLGRIAGGIAKVLFFLGKTQTFTMAMWVSSYFVGSLPGIIAHLILVPLLVLTLTKAKVIPHRYPKNKEAV